MVSAFRGKGERLKKKILRDSQDFAQQIHFKTDQPFENDRINQLVNSGDHQNKNDSWSKPKAVNMHNYHSVLVRSIRTPTRRKTALSSLLHMLVQ